MASVANASSAMHASENGPGAVLATGEEDDGQCSANAREIRHQVAFKMLAPDVARLTVTRDFEARISSKPMCPPRYVTLPNQSVVDSFAIQTDGTWRKALLRPVPKPDDPLPSTDSGPQDQPWASLESSVNNASLQMPAFRPRGRIQIRYTIWAQGELRRGGRRWDYCEDDTLNPHLVVPEIVVEPKDPSLVVRPSTESNVCFYIEKTDPPRTALSARFGAYQVDTASNDPASLRRWWWRLELFAPESLTTDPKPPESAPVVVVLDASRSMKRSGGIETQLAIARAYLANTPSAQVEFILTSRTAERVFGHLVPATEIETMLAGKLGAVALKNGSFLDRGAELAADVLRTAGKPGRVILMTDGQLRSRFNQSAVVATLKRAPPGRIVHLVYPDLASGSGLQHLAPQGLGELSAALGGASYLVNVDKKASSSSELAPMLKELVSPDRIESLELRGLQPGTEWPDFLEGRFGQEEIVAGDGRTWSGVSTKRPPARLAIVGWIWGKKVELHFQADPSFERLLPRLATSDGSLMECVVSDSHWKRALAEGFLAPGLHFWVPGSGEWDEYWRGGSDYGDCYHSVNGGGTSGPRPRQTALPQDVGAALEACRLVQSATGTIQVKLETYGDEIADVVTEGGNAEDRRCAEEALWAVALPDRFNEHIWWWTRAAYSFGLSRSPKGDASP